MRPARQDIGLRTRKLPNVQGRELLPTCCSSSQKVYVSVVGKIEEKKLRTVACEVNYLAMSTSTIVKVGSESATIELNLSLKVEEYPQIVPLKHTDQIK